MLLQDAILVRKEEYPPPLLVDTDQAASDAVAHVQPGSVRELADELPVEVEQIQMLVARAARAPDERWLSLQEVQIVVDLDPMIAALGEQHRSLQRVHVDTNEIELPRIAHLPLHGNVL